MTSNVYIRCFLLLLGLAVLSGCATFSDQFKPVEKQLVKGQYPAALEALEKIKGPDRDQVLYHMNRGMILRMDGQYEASNAAFEEAKKIAEPLQAVSITEQAGAVSVNDTMRSYAGEDFELVFLHAYKALNYLELNEPDSARIEAMQIDVRMQEIKDNYFHEDGFARYLMGMIFEALEEEDDALIAYRHAYEAYKNLQDKFRVPVPVSLKKDLLRLTYKLGFDNEHDKLRAEFSDVKWSKEDSHKGKGELIVLFNNNLAPKKREKVIQSVASGKFVRIALPYYISRPLRATHMTVNSGNHEVKGEMVENLDAIAKSTLQDQIPMITARTIARAVVKNQTASKVGDKNPLVGLLLNILGAASESADTRSWVTLPHNIHLARLSLEPGEYDFDVGVYNGSSAAVDKRRFENVRIRSGEKVFRTFHWISN